MLFACTAVVSLASLLLCHVFTRCRLLAHTVALSAGGLRRPIGHLGRDLAADYRRVRSLADPGASYKLPAVAPVSVVNHHTVNIMLAENMLAEYAGQI